MSERARRRSSKWDFKEESSFSPEHVHIPHGEVQKTSTWDEGRGYGIRTSPGHGDWRRQRDHSIGEKWDNRSSRNRRSRSRSRSPSHGIRQESVRNERNRSRPGVPCKDFSVGRCRRGDDCPFVHQGTQNYEDSREIGARRGDISRNSNPRDFREQHAGRSSSDRDRRPPCKFFAAGNCRSGKSCRFSHSGGSESPERRLDEEKSILGHNSDKASKIWEDPRFGGTSSVPDAVRYDDSRGRKRARHSRDNDWSPDGKRDTHFEPDKKNSEKVLGDLAMSPDWNYDSSTQVKDEIQHPDRSVAPTGTNENSVEKPGFSQNNMKFTENSLENPGFSQNNPKFSVNDWGGQNSNQQHYQSWDGIAPTTLNVVGQHNDASTVATAPSTEKDLFAEGKSELYMQDSNTSEIIKNTVDGAQFPQLADVSGSLAQLLGDGKQLPQLYAALNATGDALPLPQPQVLDDSTISAAPLQKANSSDDMLGDSSSPAVSKSIVNGAKDLVSSDFPSFSHAERSNNGRTGEAAEESKNREESKGVGNNGQPENTGAEKKDEEKKSKETKATRAFKFALAEYVKELLKPSWKEGLVAKDDYKTIVKKVVDKVTDSFQGPNIPQTQEKIDNYLTLSKPKLTKLVQAYVEKFQKPK